MMDIISDAKEYVMCKGANDFQISSLSVLGSSATGAGKDELFELGYPSRDARTDGAERDLRMSAIS